MNFGCLEDMIEYIYNKILVGDYYNFLTIKIGTQETIIEIFETEVPIIIHEQEIYNIETYKTEKHMIAELYAELLSINLDSKSLKIISDVLIVLNDNINLFKKWMKGDKND